MTRSFNSFRIYVVTRRRDLALAFIVALAVWLPRGIDIDQFVTIDEPPWLYRSANFYYAMTHGDYYFTYYNPLLGGSKTAGEVIARGVGLGEGLDAAARYLNAKQDSQGLKAMSWYHVGPFSYYFSGITKGISSINEFPTERLVAISRVDYLVTYVNQWKRFIPERLIVALESITPEHVIWINEIEYARIYNVNDLTPEFYQALQVEAINQD